ncbi:aldose epimerase family protein [Nostoc sp. WHI]|uniref:aldose epimerase family protein n=1 Tax=Nostoc sp. WHI TaxID=2650611 RepID=UPI0018C6D1FB|nr:aldose epimerase [Nostoc sp. WHI]
MFTIAVQQQQYKTYILSDETASSQLEVVPERGGIITRWRIQGQEIFYLDTERFTHPDLSVRGGNPILFPICGNLPDNIYTYNGQQYTLKQHGFARELPWEATESKTEDKASLTVVLNSNEQTKAVYPFDFRLAFTYELQGNTLEVRQKYENLSSTPMPFSAGFHPYFSCGDKTQLKVNIPSRQYQDNKTKEIHSFDGNFDFSQDEIDFVFGQLTSRSASVIDNSRKLELHLEYDDFSTYLVFWTVKGKEFYCLEPWSATRNSLNTGENLTVLEPGASYSASVRLRADFF